VIHVLLIGDVRLGREGIASLLAQDGQLEVSAHASEADWTRQREPVDVIVVTSAADVAGAVNRSDVPIVLLGAPEDEDAVIALAELGVVGFVEREASLDELVVSVVSAAVGEATLPGRIATTLLRHVRSIAARPRSPDLGQLTMRERQVLQLIAEGLSNKQIAARLGIEFATVKNHVHNILEKLEVTRRSDAVARLTGIDTDGAGPPPLVLAEARSTTRFTVGNQR
jgi:two-component system, NarL family, nitrate/nitrite response regulator NarL